jgi:hypothetical protein
MYYYDLKILFSSRNIIRQLKSRRRWQGMLHAWEKERKVYKVLVGNPEGKNTWKTKA